MTKREITEILELWTRRLGLERWDIEVVWTEGAHDGAHASTWRSNSYERSRIYLDQPGWKRWSTVAAEEHIVHELVHLLTRDFEEVLKMIDEQLPPAVDKVITAAFDHRLEQAVDLIARRFVAVARASAP